MPGPDSTVDVEYFKQSAAATPVPGALLVFTSDAPKCGPIPLEGKELVLGRESPKSLTLDDRSMSRRHARIALVDGRFEVEDLGSRNGLVVDGVPVGPNAKGAPGARVLRIGRTVFALLPDLRPYLSKSVAATKDEVVGPILGAAWDLIDHAARTSDVLHLHAESGAGKELAARRFHAKGARATGPFVAVNCAAIPEGVAERLLFGAKKGSFSGATSDVEGYFEAAHGGTLFLDEVGDLDLEVQAKLLRTVETREVLALGAAKPRRVDVRIVSATHVDLRRAAAEKRFRDDLFFRLCKPLVELPPLRERPEEIAFLAQAAVTRVAPSLLPSAALVEACLLREWPGNVRELFNEIEDATRRSQLKGASEVEPDQLDPEAGRRGEADEAPTQGARPAAKKLPSDDVIEAALEKSGGQVATAARALGVHRTQLRRWIAERKVPLK